MQGEKKMLDYFDDRNFDGPIRLANLINPLNSVQAEEHHGSNQVRINDNAINLYLEENRLLVIRGNELNQEIGQLERQLEYLRDQFDSVQRGLLRGERRIRELRGLREMQL